MYRCLESCQLLGGILSLSCPMASCTPTAPAPTENPCAAAAQEKSPVRTGVKMTPSPMEIKGRDHLGGFTVLIPSTMVLTTVVIIK